MTCADGAARTHKRTNANTPHPPTGPLHPRQSSNHQDGSPSTARCEALGPAWATQQRQAKTTRVEMEKLSASPSASPKRT